MRIGRVIGTVTLSRWHSSLSGGARWCLAVPLSLADLRTQGQTQAEPLVVYDDLGASPGSLIGFTEGSEAAQPFQPNPKPIDAYNAALLDHLDL